KIYQALTEQDYINRDAWTSYRVGEGLYRESNPGAALRFYEKAVNLAPYVPDFRVKYAGALFTEGQAEEGVRQLQKVIQEQPDHKVAHNNLGYHYLRSGNLEMAAYHLKQALQSDPDYELALFNKVTLAMMQNDQQAAILNLSKILKHNPDNSKAREALQQLTH
ncbi:MAG: hypothetical protein CMH28_09260, partial [Micavibrio sp.]|nr:hypothetical protein [Micavibrio sp.]